MTYTTYDYLETKQHESVIWEFGGALRRLDLSNGLPGYYIWAAVSKYASK